MREINKIDRLFRRAWAVAVVLSLLPLAGSISQVFAHGGEDHGEQKVVTKTQNGMVLRSARVGDFEILLKHPSLVPDAPTSGRLFMTHFSTNEPATGAEITAEIEAANGAVTKIPVEKTDAAGSYVVAFPALPDGHYTFRTTVSLNGKTETATLSDMTVEPAPATVDGSSWSQTILMAVLFLIGGVLFGGLVYLAIRTVKTASVSDEALAA